MRRSHNLSDWNRSERYPLLFIFKEQTYHGRCSCRIQDHVDDLNLLSDADRNAFMADVAKVTRTMQKVFQPR